MDEEMRKISKSARYSKKIINEYLFQPIRCTGRSNGKIVQQKLLLAVSSIIHKYDYARQNLSYKNKQIKQLKRDKYILEERLKHLLQSNTIKKYDEKYYKSGDYKLDVLQIDKMLEEYIEIKKFNQNDLIEQVRILLSKYWLTHTNDEIFERFGCNYVPNIEYQEKARKIMDISNLDLSRMMNNGILNRMEIKSIMQGATSYPIN